MLPHNSYRLYQIERAKSPAEIRHADEQAARLASAASSALRGITRPFRVIRGPSPPERAVCPARHDGTYSANETPAPVREAALGSR
jgi:hypothetical protein